MHRFAAQIPALLTVLTLGACAASRTPNDLPLYVERVSTEELQPIRRLMVLPVRSVDGVVCDTNALRLKLSQALTRLGRFEVLPLPEGTDEQRGIHDGIERRQLSVEELVAIGERYQVDGLVVARVSACRTYQPQQLAMQIEMVSLLDRSTLWRVDASFDAQDAAVEQDVQDYVDSDVSSDDSLHGWRMHLLSPDRFHRYAMQRVTQTLIDR